MAQSADHLIWLDLEMTGLQPERDRILEIATVITDQHLTIIAEGPVLAIRQSAEQLAAMDEWCTTQHTRSGLTARVQQSTLTEQIAEQQTLAFIQQYVPAATSPLCGNSICLDKRFLVRYMPELASYFHYRLIDVSTIKELARRWHPKMVEGFKKDSQHLALQDIRDSIEELKYYRQHFFVSQ